MTKQRWTDAQKQHPPAGAPLLVRWQDGSECQATARIERGALEWTLKDSKKTTPPAFWRLNGSPHYFRHRAAEAWWVPALGGIAAIILVVFGFGFIAAIIAAAALLMWAWAAFVAATGDSISARNGRLTGFVVSGLMSLIPLALVLALIFLWR